MIKKTMEIKLSMHQNDSQVWDVKKKQTKKKSKPRKKPKPKQTQSKNTPWNYNISMSTRNLFRDFMP